MTKTVEAVDLRACYSDQLSEMDIGGKNVLGVTYFIHLME